MVRSPVRSFVERVAGRLRFPYLFMLTVLLFALDLFIPDVIPFADEILLGLGVVLLGGMRKKIAPSESTVSSPSPPEVERRQT